MPCMCCICRSANDCYFDCFIENLEVSESGDYIKENFEVTGLPSFLTPDFKDGFPQALQPCAWFWLRRNVTQTTATDTLCGSQTPSRRSAVRFWSDFHVLVWDCAGQKIKDITDKVLNSTPGYVGCAYAAGCAPEDCSGDNPGFLEIAPELVCN